MQKHVTRPRLLLPNMQMLHSFPNQTVKTYFLHLLLFTVYFTECEENKGGSKTLLYFCFQIHLLYTLINSCRCIFPVKH